MQTEKKKKDMLFCASPDGLLPASKVKMILDYSASITKKIVATQNSIQVRSLIKARQKRRSVVWMDGNIFYLSSVLSDTLASRVEGCGEKMLKVARGFYISTQHIDGVFRFNSTLATKIRKESLDIPNTKFSFIRDNVNKKRNATILLTTGENISVVNTPESLSKRLYDV